MNPLKDSISIMMATMKGDKLFLKYKLKYKVYNISNLCSPHFKNNPDCNSDKVFLFEYINKGWITI